MLSTKYIVSVAIIGGLLLAGCNQPPSADLDSAANKPVDQTESTLPEESTGDVDQDLEDIEAEIDSLDVDTDFPPFDESDFE